MSLTRITLSNIDGKIAKQFRSESEQRKMDYAPLFEQMWKIYREYKKTCSVCQEIFFTSDNRDTCLIHCSGIKL